MRLGFFGLLDVRIDEEEPQVLSAKASEKY
jgi:hypothetical protein